MHRSTCITKHSETQLSPSEPTELRQRNNSQNPQNKATTQQTRIRIQTLVTICTIQQRVPTAVDNKTTTNTIYNSAVRTLHIHAGAAVA